MNKAVTMMVLCSRCVGAKQEPRSAPAHYEFAEQAPEEPLEELHHLHVPLLVHTGILCVLFPINFLLTSRCINWPCLRFRSSASLFRVFTGDNRHSQVVSRCCLDVATYDAAKVQGAAARHRAADSGSAALPLPLPSVAVERERP